PGPIQVEGDKGDGRHASPGAPSDPSRPTPSVASARPPAPPGPGGPSGRAGRPPRPARTDRRTVPVVASRNCVSRPSPPPVGSGCPPSPMTSSYVVPETTPTTAR